nr:lysylphosphatidylglycerol synthase domain-containing protein [Oscillatoria sp. FACHB-1406]
MKRTVVSLKPYLRWAIVGATLFFLASTIRNNWQEVVNLRLVSSGWVRLAIAFGITLVAHLWSGWVWGWILKEFKQSVGILWSIRVYLITNIAKYLPGNVWHFYGRMKAARSAGIPSSIALLSVLMEPLLMAAAALCVALFSLPQANIGLQFIIFLSILVGFHPRIFNPVLNYLARLKAKKKQEIETSLYSQRWLKRYPILPFLGELGFIAFRCGGFLVAMSALRPLQSQEIPALVSAFCLAWLLGLVIPGVPGGIGVFEATAIALLKTNFSPGIIISVVALYRLISTFAEAVGAGLAWLYKPTFKTFP